MRTVATSYAPSAIKKGDTALRGYRLTDLTLIKTMLGRIFNEAVDTQLLDFFQSEYLVHWLSFSVTRQALQQGIVSFRWHCDKGPSQHLKLIIYLNASAEHGGNTEFIGLDDTRRVGAKGYVFGWTKTRTGDVRHLERLAGRPLKTHIKAMRAGEGILFQPANVLHRGVSPRYGDRHVLTLNLLPSPVPWRDALHKGALSDLACDAKWHRHADALLHRIEGGR